MKADILKCHQCGSYGLTKDCTCGGKRVNSKPPKYSPEDKHAKYRQQAKQRNLDNR